MQRVVCNNGSIVAKVSLLRAKSYSRKFHTTKPVFQQPQPDTGNEHTLRNALNTANPIPTPIAQPQIERLKEEEVQTIDGNQAAAYVAYGMSDAALIYPISPSSAMGEHMDSWMADGKPNCLGNVVQVSMMQSEGGAAGALHGASASGAFCSTFTSSQGLLLMIPNMYLLAGELTPAVLHVAARTVSKHSLSIFGDHTDVMACRQTGFAFLCSNNPQEVMDFALVAHIASLKTRLPFLHFFEGWRTSHTMTKVRVIPYDAMKKLYPYEAREAHLSRMALNPQHPIARGVQQRSDVFFQQSVAANKYYLAAPSIIQSVFDDVAKLTGRQYHLFEYVGAPDADRVVIMMGSGAETTEEVVEYLLAKGQKVGLVKVRLFRPWKSDVFLQVLPKSAKRIAVLDRTREDGAQGNPLYLDVCSSLIEAGDMRLVVGGEYGISSKEYTPGMAKSVFDNLASPQPKRRFTVGIVDDVTHTSLEYDDSLSTLPEGTRQCVFWGLGGDGTIGANKEAIKNLAIDGEREAQAYFAYDSHKTLGVTMSYLRFGPNKIKAEYKINTNADYIACHHPSFVGKYDLLSAIKKGGTFVLNCSWSSEELEAHFSDQVKKQIADNDVQLYVIDAFKVAQEAGMGRFINQIMQACFYQLSGVMPPEEAITTLKKSVDKMYKKKGPEVINKNKKAIDSTLANLIKINYPKDKWSNSKPTAQQSFVMPNQRIPSYIRQVVENHIESILHPCNSLEGDKIPVSAFVPGGYVPTSTSQFERRGLAAQVPVWEPEKCTQCNYCAVSCPHSVIRPFLLTRAEAKSAPTGFKLLNAKGGAELSGLHYSIQVDAMDCTGCAVCVRTCPDDALHMHPFESVSKEQMPYWDFAINLPPRNPLDKTTVKGSQFTPPLLEFPEACAGCGESPYMKILTQLFGERMVIANASGCSSVLSQRSLTVNSRGQGPAWGRSLFEDNAEYGFGMFLGNRTRRQTLAKSVQQALDTLELSTSLRTAFSGWLETMNEYDKALKHIQVIESVLPGIKDSNPLLSQIYDRLDIFRPQSQWIIGGDGWAYDIGFGGLDHVISLGLNVNILVLDTELYSNTGGQVSKATQLSTVVKFASDGKSKLKKDLGRMAMTYENVYVASVALGADMNQTLKAFKEAESYPGPSIIIALAPCIDWGIESNSTMTIMKQAVECGYWPMYRFDPRNTLHGRPALTLDTPAIIKGDMEAFLHSQNRFDRLQRENPDKAQNLHKELARANIQQHAYHKRMSMDDQDLLEHLQRKLGQKSSGGSMAMILYGSETGHAAEVAKGLSHELKRREIRAKVLPLDDFDVEDLPNISSVYVVISTCGQGEIPNNAKSFWKALSDPSRPSDWLNKCQFAVFGLGDSSYLFFNKAAKMFDSRLSELGGNRVVPLGIGDDKHDEKYESAWQEWLPELWSKIGAPSPAKELMPPNYQVTISSSDDSSPLVSLSLPEFTPAKLTVNRRLSPTNHFRSIVHYEFDTGDAGLTYNAGDVMWVQPHNPPEAVTNFAKVLGLNLDSIVRVENPSDKVPTGLTVGQILGQVLDICGRPQRRFLELMEMLASEDSQREQLSKILSPSGKEDMKKLLSETPTYAELLLKFPSVSVPLGYLLDYIPALRPRLYSIASAPELHKDRVHLCIVENQWKADHSPVPVRNGVCTNYLQNQKEGTKLNISVRPGSFALPSSHETPMVLVALGTGIAPCRSLLQQRKAAFDRGEKVGPTALFIGVRHQSSEYHYRQEWESMHDNGKGFLKGLFTAFSHDQPNLIFVQHKMEEVPELLYEYLGNNKGYFLMCGPAGDAPTAIRNAIAKSFVSVGKNTAEQAETLLTEMQLSGRYNNEVW